MNRTGYQSLSSPSSNELPVEETPHEVQENDDVMFHVVPDTNKTRWNHIEDLDSFFTRVYYYHQKHGFLCIVLQECFELIQFIFVVGFATFLLECVDYDRLFNNLPRKNDTQNPNKVTIPDVIYPVDQCISNFNFPMWITLLVALIFWAIRLIRVIRNTILNIEIRAFFQTALNVQDNDLDNLTWYDVQKRLREVQREQQMCIHKQELTELDIYHRILRFKNYMIAMMNKKLLPLRFTLPIFGDIIFFTHGLKYNFEMLLFWGPWAPFENNWHLKEDYKKVSKRKELANALANRIMWVGLANLILAPLIFLWQILYSFFSYAENVKREPGALGMRQWSRYGRIYLRHFNELEHEINGRLVRAYRPASRYMSIFNSPLLSVIAQNIAFITGAVFAVLTALTIWDEDVITVEHVLLVITVLGAVMAVCRAFIPDEHLVWCPEKLLTAVLAHVHYFPEHWKGQAHTSKTRDQFAYLFQYKVVYLIEELLSPVFTPIILLVCLRPKALEIVDFYRNFTVEMLGVGDVCSFAQMDVGKHGNPAWQTTFNDMDGSEYDPPSNNNAYTQAENGKTELSLIHFTHTNPEWRPPQESSSFINNLKERACRDAANLPTVFEENALFSSLNSMSSLGNECSSIVENFIQGTRLSVPPVFQAGVQAPESMNIQQQQQQQHASIRGFLSRHEGPIYGPHRGIVSGIQQSGISMGNTLSPSNNISFANSFAHYPSTMPPPSYRSPTEAGSTNLEASTFNMCLDALYVHELHHQEVRRRHLRTSSAGHPNQTLPFVGTSTYQPLVHHQQQSSAFNNPTSAATSRSEKTPLLPPTGHFHQFSL